MKKTFSSRLINFDVSLGIPSWKILMELVKVANNFEKYFLQRNSTYGSLFKQIMFQAL